MHKMRGWKGRVMVGALTATLFLTPGRAYAGWPVIDFSNLFQAITQGLELYRQGKHMKQQADTILEQAKNWKDMGIGDWMDLGGNIVDFGFAVEDMSHFAGQNVLDSFKEAFPRDQKWGKGMMPSAHDVAGIVDASQSVVQQNQVQGHQITRAATRLNRVLERAKNADTDSKVLQSQTEVQAAQAENGLHMRKQLGDVNAQLANLTAMDAKKFEVEIGALRQDSIRLEAMIHGHTLQDGSFDKTRNLQPSGKNFLDRLTPSDQKH